MDQTTGTPSDHHHHTDPHRDSAHPHVAVARPVTLAAPHSIQIDEDGAVVTLRLPKRSPDDDPHLPPAAQAS